MPRTCGFIVARMEMGEDMSGVDLAAVHCSESMAYAYFHQKMKHPRSMIDRSSSCHDGQSSIAIFTAGTNWSGRSHEIC